MQHVLIVTSRRDRFMALAEGLAAESGIPVQWASDGRSALEAAGRKAPALAVVDEALDDMGGIDFNRHLMTVNAFINTAMASDMEEDAFHEACEGLGIAARLPLKPGPEDALGLIAILKRDG